MELKKILLAAAVILIIAVVIFSLFQKPKISSTYLPEEIERCGNEVCEIDEDCKTCQEDCGCGSNEYCDADVAICRAEVCGNGTCANEEKETCCQDCGCPESEICNKSTQLCQTKSILTNEEAKAIASKYLRDKNMGGSIISVTDTYYAEQAVTVVSVDCREEEHPYPCFIQIYINSDGEIIDTEIIS